ncbi:MAG: acylphosphatase [candidate division WS1 bacterium]|jgi:acylphosphatase|nr:acylphosphatase [candidate division WS1 bacterium]
MSAGADQRRLEATVRGRVQGVGFRYFVQREARNLGLSGWVRNLRSGDVELVAEGPEEDLKRLLGTIRKGPPMSWVERVDERWREPRGESTDFEVTYTV